MDFDLIKMLNFEHFFDKNFTKFQNCQDLSKF